MALLSKLRLYAESAWAQRNLNWRGLPLIPKRLWPSLPANRAAYNEFVLWIKSLQIPRVEWVVDVGANHGDFSQAAAALYPKANILLVEPLPNLQAELERRCRERGRGWRLAPCALGSRVGSTDMYVDPRNDAIGSLVAVSGEYRRVNPQVQSQQTISCALRTLDDLCAEERIQHIDLLKIDVEGFEFEVLKGARLMLPRTCGLILEISLVRRGVEGNAGLAQLLPLLCEWGFAVAGIIPSLYSVSEPWLPVEFNVLARRLARSWPAKSADIR